MGMKRKQMKLREDIQIEHSVLKELLDLISELDSLWTLCKINRSC
ncbi:Uncharacterised protein [Serratia fonticola]|uniref:Uncharacterized protein n=1 Tax=Serratia fonticola TaxID=47917 RepID=A0A4U9WJS3_SERFO|nr:Uncharacterised protein [Serratia fonticola]